jgi:uncharacterized peroxidase-related enzyme
MPMTLTLPPADPLPERIAKYFGVCEETLGFVPNVLKAHAFAPEKLDAFTAMYDEIMLRDSGLTKLEREMMAVVVSARNRCFYCLVAHGAAVRALSGNPALGEMLAFNWRVAPLEPRDRALLAFAEKVTDESYRVDDLDREALGAVGLSDRDIWDAASVAAFFNMTNRLASAVGMRPNAEYHAQAR